MDMPLPRAVVPAADNVPDYAVSEIAGAIKRTLKDAFGRVRVRGEVTELKRYPSGHVYLSLKDENAKLEAVVWKTNVPRLAVRPENGVEVLATGRIDTYADRSKYQLVIDRLDYAGEGAMLARIERLRLRLLEEGLFDPERKKPIPLLPRVIGVVTSERGAVIQDIRTTVARRFPRRILLWPVQVQGAGAAEGIAAAIEGFGALPLDGPVPRPDVLIVARGGGSLEDLMAFNEEAVVRAAAACPIPLISAVGHETDTTLIDFASDRRAPTPTAAAEMAVPQRADLLADLAQQGARLRHGLRAVLESSRRQLMLVERGLPDLPGILGGLRQRMEDRAERLDLALPVLLDRRRGALGRLAPRLPHPREGIANRRAALAAQFGRAEVGAQRVLARGRTSKAIVCFSPAPVRALLRENAVRLDGIGARLGSVSYQAVLARGFALVQDAEGATLTAAADVPPGGRLVLTFADGQVGTTADGTKPGPGRRRDGRDSADQGALL